jgi:hypothetical protein
MRRDHDSRVAPATLSHRHSGRPAAILLGARGWTVRTNLASSRGMRARALILLVVLGWAACSGVRSSATAGLDAAADTNVAADADLLDTAPPSDSNADDRAPDLAGRDGSADLQEDARSGDAAMCGTPPDRTKAPYTPGVAACGASCPASQCMVCWARGDGGMFNSYRQCGATPWPQGGGCTADDCDGPEDCPLGQSCWSYLFNEFTATSSCSAAPPQGFSPARRVCRADADCPCDQRCNSGQCS